MGGAGRGNTSNSSHYKTFHDQPQGVPHLHLNAGALFSNIKEVHGNESQRQQVAANHHEAAQAKRPEQQQLGEFNPAQILQNMRQSEQLSGQNSESHLRLHTSQPALGAQDRKPNEYSFQYYNTMAEKYQQHPPPAAHQTLPLQASDSNDHLQAQGATHAGYGTTASLDYL